jgi:hypothetical protein
MQISKGAVLLERNKRTCLRCVEIERSMFTQINVGVKSKSG